MNEVTPSISIAKNKVSGEKTIKTEISRENFLELLATTGIAVRFEVQDEKETVVRTITFALERPRDTEIRININDGTTRIGYVGYQYGIGAPNMDEYYSNRQIQSMYEGGGIMTAGISILFEVAKQVGLRKVEATTSKKNLASINSTLNARSLFTGEAYNTEVIESEDSVDMITHL